MFVYLKTRNLDQSKSNKSLSKWKHAGWSTEILSWTPTNLTMDLQKILNKLYFNPYCLSCCFLDPLCALTSACFKRCLMIFCSAANSNVSLSAFSGIVSLISLVILSYDRYSTLTVYNKQGTNYRKPLLAVGGTWLYSLFWTVPPLLGWSSYGIEGAGTSCSVSWTVQTAQSHAYIICLFTFCLGLPVLVMIYCYSRLLWAVKQVETYHMSLQISLSFPCLSALQTVFGV